MTDLNTDNVVTTTLGEIHEGMLRAPKLSAGSIWTDQIAAGSVLIDATTVQPRDSRAPIGLSGFAQSGKTTAANYLESKYGFTRLHIADPLRSMLRELLFYSNMSPYEIDRYLTGDLKETIIPCLGVTSRHAQITLGTEWGREQITPDLWVNFWDMRAKRCKTPAMNDSVRFPNEESIIRVNGGHTVLIVRPDKGPAAFKWGRFGKWMFDVFGCMWGVHDSERTDRLRPDFVIYNTGTLDQLYAMLDEVMMYASWHDGVRQRIHGWDGITPIELRPELL